MAAERRVRRVFQRLPQVLVAFQVVVVVVHAASFAGR